MIEVLQASPLLTIQDLGRTGLRHLGIPQCGAMDPYALSMANWLVGNAADLAGLEIMTTPLSLRCANDHVIALTGHDYRARLVAPDGRESPLACGFSHRIPAGHVIHFPAAKRQGGRAYLTVAGGIDVPSKLNARSTDLVNRFGGLEGRPLQRHDTLPVTPTAIEPAEARTLANAASNIQATILSSTGPGPGIRPWAATGRLRAVPGVDNELFSGECQQDFWHHPWTISHNLSRTGIRLDGRKLDTPPPADRLSAGVLPGMIQVPGGEQIILLSADAQTTGGYPCIASVITADLWQLAYLQPGQEITFVPVSIAEAQGQNTAIRQYMHRMAERLGIDDHVYQ